MKDEVVMGQVRNEKLEVIGKFQMGVRTTYDPSTDTFGNASTIIGGPFSAYPLSVEAALVMVREARRRHGLG